MTTWQEAKAAIPAQIAAIKAGTRSDEEKAKIVARLRRMQRELLGAQATTGETDKDRRDAWKTCRDMQTTPSYYDEAVYQAEMTSLLQGLTELPVDDPDPTVLDQKKIENHLKKVEDVAQTAHASEATRRYATEKLVQFFGQAVVPEVVDIAASIGMLTGTEIPVESVLYDLAREVASKGSKLRPTT